MGEERFMVLAVLFRGSLVPRPKYVTAADGLLSSSKDVAHMNSVPFLMITF